MRGVSIGGLVAAALAVGLIAATAAAPIPADTETAVAFLVSTCLNSADNLDAVTTLADQNKWNSMLDPGAPGKNPIRIVGMWRVSQNGQSYMVATGIGPRDKTSCQVMFDAPKPKRDDFVAAVSKTLTLKALIDQGGSDWRTEIYQIDNLAPKHVVLQFVSAPDGKVFEASVMGPP